MKILAVIVTHNRATLLNRCLDALKSQSLRPNTILVVNNGSTDNTDEVIKKHNIVEIKQANLGSAGGWYSGIKFCIENGFDACWLMDDDGYPEKNALRNLKNNLLSTDSCLSSCVLKEELKSDFVFPLPKLNSSNNPVLFSFKRKYLSFDEINFLDSSYYNFAHLFNGSLIKADVIRNIGNVNKDYFIMGDEVDYFYRLRSEGNVRTIFSAKHFHPDVSNRKYSEIKIYYLIRNTIINHNKYFDQKLLRNICLLIIVLIRVMKRNGFLFFLRIIFNKNNLILKATYNGFRGRLGIDKLS